MIDDKIELVEELGEFEFIFFCFGHNRLFLITEPPENRESCF